MSSAAVDLMRARHRLSKLLLRHGVVYCGGSAWTAKHDAWLRAQRFERAPTGLALDSDYDTVTVTLARRDRLDAAIEAMAAESESTALVRRLACLRGVSTLTAFALAVEIGDWTRFTGNTIGSFVGLVPSEHSSGGSLDPGPITKTGNRHLRRLLARPPGTTASATGPDAPCRDRWALAPAAAVTRADTGNRRLHHRWARFDARQKKPVVASVAIARELAGWCWSLAVMDDR